MADPMTPERLDELVDIDPLQIRDAAVSLLTRAETAEAEVERLRAELAEYRADFMNLRNVADRLRAERNEARTESDVSEGAAAAWRTAYDRLSRNAVRLRHAWQSARRGRKQARAELDDLRAQNAKTEDNFRDFAEDALAVQRERDRLAEQVGLVRTAHPRQTDAQGNPVCGACLGAYEELMPWPCPTMAALDGEEAGQ